jgi:hypothetical protein
MVTDVEEALALEDDIAVVETGAVELDNVEIGACELETVDPGA